MKETEHRIVISHAARQEMAKTYNLNTIRAALSFKRDSSLANRIRLEAMRDYGGKEVWV